MDNLTEQQGSETSRSVYLDPESIRFECREKPVWKVAQNVAKTLESEPRRKTGQWDIRQRSAYIESMLVRMPLQPVYLNVNMEVESVLDGLERLHAICDYLAGEFALTGLRFCANLEGLRFQELAREFQRRIETTDLPVVSPAMPIPDATLQVMGARFCPERFSAARI